MSDRCWPLFYTSELCLDSDSKSLIVVGKNVSKNPMRSFWSRLRHVKSVSSPSRLPDRLILVLLFLQMVGLWCSTGSTRVQSMRSASCSSFQKTYRRRENRKDSPLTTGLIIVLPGPPTGVKSCSSLVPRAGLRPKPLEDGRIEVCAAQRLALLETCARPAVSRQGNG